LRAGAMHRLQEQLGRWTRTMEVDRADTHQKRKERKKKAEDSGFFEAFVCDTAEKRREVVRQQRYALPEDCSTTFMCFERSGNR
jgi:hypothetical protein